MEDVLWSSTFRFKYKEAVWSSDPVFFHGYVIGFAISGKGEFLWVVEATSGSKMIVQDKNLDKPKQQQILQRST